MTQDSRRTALLLVDYQVGLCRSGEDCLAPPLAAAVARHGVLATAAGLLSEARGRGAFVLHVGLAFDPTYELRTNRTARFDGYPLRRKMMVGSPEAAFMPEVAPAEGEPVFLKGSVDPFVASPLRLALAARRIDRVILAGVATNLAVESAARHAADVGLDVVVAEDACASFDDDMHAFAMARTLPLFATVSTGREVEW